MKQLVVSVSPNTSTDRVSIVEHYIPGEPARTIESFDQAGGSGAHSTGVVHQLGGESCTIVLLGDYNRDRWTQAANRHQLPYDYVEMASPNRSTFVLLDKYKGNMAEIIDPGPQTDDNSAQQLIERITQYLDDTGILILSGSLPPGIPVDFYAQAIRLARQANVKTLVDASAAPLHHAIKERPWVLKPNLFEFHQLVGVQTNTLDEHIAQLSRIAGVHAEIMLLSLGNNGILVATEDRMWHMILPDHGITLPETNALNTIGCGDALVGAFSYAYVRNEDVLESARWGIAAATATLGTYGVPDCPPELVRDLQQKVVINPITTVVQK